MKIHLMTKSKVMKQKAKNVLHGGAVKANDLFKVQGKSALHDMLKKPSTLQRYISFS